MGLCQRPKECIDGDRSAATSDRLMDEELSVFHFQLEAGGYYVDMIYFDRRWLGDLQHRHPGGALKYVRRMAVMVGR